MDIMTPSKTATKKPTKAITEKQINKAVSNYRALLEKHSSEFPSEAVQKALAQSELAHDMLSVFRHRVEIFANLIIRLVEKVVRTLSPQQVLDNTGRVQYTDKDVVKTMPHGSGENGEVVFFHLGRGIIDDDLEKEYALRGLVPADAYSLAKANQDDPEFADTKPNCTHWKGKNGEWCYISFHGWDGEPHVDVYRYGNVWGDCWWFAGLRKSPQDSEAEDSQTL